MRNQYLNRYLIVTRYRGEMHKWKALKGWKGVDGLRFDQNAFQQVCRRIATQINKRKSKDEISQKNLYLWKHHAQSLSVSFRDSDPEYEPEAQSQSDGEYKILSVAQIFEYKWHVYICVCIYIQAMVSAHLLARERANGKHFDHTANNENKRHLVLGMITK